MDLLPSRYFTKTTKEANTYEHKTTGLHQLGRILYGCCALASQRSKDPSTQVGACIVNDDNRIMSVGYNGFPRGCSDDEFPWEREGDKSTLTKYPYVCHAELNAI